MNHTDLFADSFSCKATHKRDRHHEKYSITINKLANIPNIDTLDSEVYVYGKIVRPTLHMND
jgi:hypothetical protein